MASGYSPTKKIKTMSKETAIKLFEQKQVRSVWSDEEEKWYFSIVDIVGILSDSVEQQAYWRKLKQRLKEEGNETVTNCHALKMLAADGKMRLTDEITKAWSGLTTKQYKKFKDLKKENLRDHMTNLELVLNMLTEASTTEISKDKRPETFEENKVVARKGGKVAKAARLQLENTTGKKVVTRKNAMQIEQKKDKEIG